MPWKIEQNDGKHCVVKEGGEMVKCHATRQEALDHMKALYANEDKEAVSATLLDRLTNAIKNVLQQQGSKSRADTVLHPAESPVVEDGPTTSNRAIYKDQGGTYHVVLRYSNKFRDDDWPQPEIISDASHRKFAKMVELGAAEPPELWLWHEPMWKWGEGEWVAYDDAGFAISSHRVFPEFNDLAELLAQKDDVGVSHGMPWWSIERAETDETIITGHVTQEVSPLPMWAAANKLTSYHVSKENDMENKGIPAETKRLLMEQWGVSPVMLDRLEAFNAEDELKAAAETRDSKEAGAPPATEPETPAVTPEAAPEATPAADEKAAPVEVTIPDELKEVMTETMAAVIALTGQVALLKKELSEIKKTEEEKLTAKAASTSTAGLLDLMRKSVSAVGSEETVVDGRTKLAKSGPAQAAEQKTGGAVFGMRSFIDDIVDRQVGGSN